MVAERTCGGSGALSDQLPGLPGPPVLARWSPRLVPVPASCSWLLDPMRYPEVPWPSLARWSPGCWILPCSLLWVPRVLVPVGCSSPSFLGPMPRVLVLVVPPRFPENLRRPRRGGTAVCTLVRLRVPQPAVQPAPAARAPLSSLSQIRRCYGRRGAGVVMRGKVLPFSRSA